ncbi:Exocyst complex component 5 [Blastocladiella emersonii ATCC 22665]|nr:Exocyst complex component 5 [Blastocladiella emersonii ATCC 22665]
MDTLPSLRRKATDTGAKPPPAKPPPASSGGGGAAFQINLSAFSDPNFKVKTLVDAITFRPLSQTRVGGGGGSAGDFDVRPFAAVFDATMDDLVRLRKKVQREIDDVEDSMAASEVGYKQRVGELGTAFRSVYGAFDTLEARVSEVGHTAVRIGEQLETIDKLRTKAADVRELLRYFLDFNKGVSDRLEALRTSGPNGQLRAAVIARRLQQVVRDMDAPGTDTVRTGIDRYCETLEADLLRDFERAAAPGANDVPSMRQAAAVLTEFNGGESAVRVWISQHPLFTASSMTGARPRFGEGGPNNNPAMGDAGLRKLFEQIRATIYQDWELVAAVFAHPLAVMTQLVQRFFQQTVHLYLEQLLDEAAQVSDVFYLRTLAAAHAAARTLVRDLAHFDATVLKTGGSGGGAPASAAADGPAAPSSDTLAAAESGFANSGGLVRVVEQAVDDLFAPYQATTDRELAHLNNVVATTFRDALAYYGGRKQQKKGMFSRMQKSAPAAPLEHHVSTDHVMAVLAAHADSVDRCLALNADPPAALAKVYAALVAAVFPKYVEVALDAAWEEATAAAAGTEPDFRVLTTVQAANTAVQLMQAHFESRMVPVLAAHPAVHRGVVDVKNAALDRIEARAGAIVAHLVSAVIAHVQTVLAKQKKTDFRARGDDLDMAAVAHQLASPTCVSICELLSRVHGHTTAFLDGANARAVLHLVAVQVHAQLLEHLRKFPVSTTGALTLARDVAKYQDAVVAGFKLGDDPRVAARFDLLREISNLFLVRPENLPALLGEGLVAQLDTASVAAYLSNRADFKSARIDDLLYQRGQQMAAAAEAAAAAAAGGGSHEDGLGSEYTLNSDYSGRGLDESGGGGGGMGSVFSLKGV